MLAPMNAEMCTIVSSIYSCSAYTKTAFSSYDNISALRKSGASKQNLRREFPQLMANHIFRNLYVVVYLPIVYLEYQAHEIRQNRRRPCLCLNRRRLLSGRDSNNWQSAQIILGF
jgi:hypothetical protein